QPGLRLGLALALLVLALVLARSWTATEIWNPLKASAPFRELTSIGLADTTGRLQIWSDSLAMLRGHALWGIGPGHYAVHLPAYLEKIPEVPYLLHWNVRTGDLLMPLRPHNDYLQTWLELGLPGLFSLLWLFAAVAWMARQGIKAAWQSHQPCRALLIAGTFSGFAAWAVAMLFEFPFHMPASALVGWLCAGLTVALSLPAVHCRPLRLFLLLRTGLTTLALVLVLTGLAFAYRQFWSDIYVHQSALAAADQDIEHSYRWIRNAYAHTPWKAQAGASKARLELLLDRPEEALATSKAILQRDPHFLPALWAKGVAAGMLGHKQESRDAFQAIVEIYPFLPDIERYRRFGHSVVNREMRP
ncbi:MAG TPA: O-antigen ligase family protein, partial [Desulfuromonadales bacterium]|nr:O-antigen ligase family protein [Desulfuromonadales bacterium]